MKKDNIVIYLRRIINVIFALTSIGLKKYKRLNKIILYYYHVFNNNVKEISFKPNSNITINYIIKINFKKRQLKLTLNKSNNKTIFTVTTGTLLIFNKVLKKSSRKNTRSNLIFFKFIQKTITKIIKDKGYFVEIKGAVKKLQKIKNVIDNSLQKNLKGVIFLPSYEFYTYNKKKIRSIKRKLLRRNLTNFLTEIKTNKIV